MIVALNILRFRHGFVLSLVFLTLISFSPTPPLLALGGITAKKYIIILITSLQTYRNHY